MFVAHYERTMAGARHLSTRREKLVALSREWECRRARQMEIRASRLRAENALFPAARRASAHELIERVAGWYGLGIDDILGPSRARDVISARQDAMAAVRLAYPTLSLPVIGKFFRRDHTTVLHALRKRGVPTAARRATDA